jgi:hypothetical protein
MSQARARLKSFGCPEHLIRKRLSPGGCDYEHDVKEGGALWLRVQERIAKEHNDTARLEELKPLLDAKKAEFAALMAMARG